MRRTGRRGRAVAPVAGTVVALLVLVALGAGARAAGYPPVPLADDRGFLGNLSAPYLAPGDAGAITFTVGDPLSTGITGTELTLQVYAFNGFPGNATADVPVSGAPVLSNATGSGGLVVVAVGTLTPGGLAYRGSVEVATSVSTPSGTFAVRAALTFEANGTEYLLESRGWFTAAQWAAATELPGGGATLNLSLLGVSGVIPETAVLVQSSSFPWALTGILAGAVVLVGLGAWVYFRRGPGSSSGMRSADDDHHAPRAFGSKRTSDGD
ncbi:MAG: hypothetical protein WBF81_08410 [Thermoplasmata archaeon]